MCAGTRLLVVRYREMCIGSPRKFPIAPKCRIPLRYLVPRPIPVYIDRPDESLDAMHVVRRYVTSMCTIMHNARSRNSCHRRVMQHRSRLWLSCLAPPSRFPLFFPHDRGTNCNWRAGRTGTKEQTTGVSQHSQKSAKARRRVYLRPVHIFARASKNYTRLGKSIDRAFNERVRNACVIPRYVACVRQSETLSYHHGRTRYMDEAFAAGLRPETEDECWSHKMTAMGGDGRGDERAAPTLLPIPNTTVYDRVATCPDWSHKIAASPHSSSITFH